MDGWMDCYSSEEEEERIYRKWKKYSFDCLCSGNVEEIATALQVQLPA